MFSLIGGTFFWMSPLNIKPVPNFCYVEFVVDVFSWTIVNGN